MVVARKIAVQPGKSLRAMHAVDHDESVTMPTRLMATCSW